MLKPMKVLHLISLTLFLGSIFGHIVAGLAGGAVGGEGFLWARRSIAVATSALTVPGLALAMVSGAAMAALTPARRRWMIVHAALALAVARIAVFAVPPAGAGANVGPALAREHAFGALNILLTLAIVALGVFKPSLTKPNRPEPV